MTLRYMNPITIHQQQRLQTKMGLQNGFYPHGGFRQPGYVQAHDHYSKNEYDYKEDHYSENAYHESGGSSMRMMRPYIVTMQPAKHFVPGPEGYAQQESGFGKQQSYYGHNTHGHGYPQRDGFYGKSHVFSGLGRHGYPKPSNGMNYGTSNNEYESHHESRMQMGPGRYESMGYDYDHYADGRNSCPPYYEQQYKATRNLDAKGAEFVDKGL